MRSTLLLRRRLLARDATVAVVGQGYVGLSLGCAAAEAGFEVTGVDGDGARVHAPAPGEAVGPGGGAGPFRRGVATGRLRFPADADCLAAADVICICVPTPVRDHTPDLSYVEQACRDVAQRLVGGRLVILESSTYPGTTSDLVGPLLEAPGRRVGRDFLLAYSPERIDPGNVEFHFGNTPRIVR